MNLERLKPLHFYIARENTDFVTHIYLQAGKTSYDDAMDNSEDEDTHDAYMERMKLEGKDRFEGDEDDDSDSSDVSYNPGLSGSDVAEE